MSERKLKKCNIEEISVDNKITTEMIINIVVNMIKKAKKTGEGNICNIKYLRSPYRKNGKQER